ncbi:MAG: type II toxin-antitoxin system YafQ family toxin [Cyclobacteriaceae bacterium]|nr:type II toxin-antitoxin system YafQ family toxin [Cyclobacteriaceae bacterium]
MYELFYTTKFKKDLKKFKMDFVVIGDFLKALQERGIQGVPEKMSPHRLKGNYKGNWECHLKPDLLVIWFQIEEPKKITLVRIGSHADLF